MNDTPLSKRLRLIDTALVQRILAGTLPPDIGPALADMEAAAERIEQLEAGATEDLFTIRALRTVIEKIEGLAESGSGDHGDFHLIEKLCYDALRAYPLPPIEVTDV